MALGRNASWVEPYVESPWVKLAAAVAPDFPSPDSATSSATWRRFLEGCVGGATAPLVLGFAVAIAVLVRSCVCHRLQAHSRPRSKPLVRVSRLALLLTLAGMIVFFSVGRHGMLMAITKLGEAADDASSAESAGVAVAANTVRIADSLVALSPTCPIVVQEQLAGVRRQLVAATTAIHAFNAHAAEARSKLHSAHSAASSARTAALLGLALPSIFVLACCFVIVSLVRMTERRRPRSGCCNHSIVRGLSVFLFVPTIILVALATSGEVFLTFTTGSFCKGVDTNVLTYTHHFAGDFAYNATRYYITGQGSNPLWVDLRDANASLAEVGRVVAVVKPGGKGGCDAQGAFDSITQELGEAGESINAAASILSPEHVYSYYRIAVHEEMCSTFISTIAWLLLPQFLLGIIVLPTLACMANSFYEHWAASCEEARASLAHDRPSHPCHHSSAAAV